jgi:hypothetical protein
VTKYRGKQRVTHMNWSPVLDTAVHCLDVLSNLCRNLGILRFGHGHHTVLDFRHFALDLIVMLQQKMEIFPILCELRIRSSTAASATPEASTPAIARSALRQQFAGQ